MKKMKLPKLWYTFNKNKEESGCTFPMLIQAQKDNEPSLATKDGFVFPQKFPEGNLPNDNSFRMRQELDLSFKSSFKDSQKKNKSTQLNMIKAELTKTKNTNLIVCMNRQ